MRAKSELNQAVYGLAYEYLVEMLPERMTKDDLEKYFNGDLCDFKTLEEAFDGLVHSAQNMGRSPNVIKYQENKSTVKSLLHDFDLNWIAAQSEDDIYKLFCENFPISNPDSKRNLWRGWSKTIIDGAKLLSSFSEVEDFRKFISCFSYNAETREALPLLIANKINGFGFALACDWLKELGYVDYPKPDVHLKEVFSALNLAEKKDLPVFEAIIRMADDCDVTPYKVDKVFWLICSGRFYHLDDQYTVGSHKAEFIAHAKKELGIN